MKELEFPIAEYERRLSNAQAAMVNEKIDAILITSEDHFRYFTGFHSPTWSNLTRPRYAVIPRVGDIILVVPSSNTIIVERTCWPSDVRTWTSPNPVDDGISLLRQAIGNLRTTYGRIGAEMGSESRLTMPVADFLRLGKEISPMEIVDAYALLRGLLAVKSPAEIDKIERIGRITSDAYEALPTKLRSGMTIQQACTAFKRDVLDRGAESLPYVIGVAERYGYPCINLEPNEKIISAQDVLVIDTAASYHGYHCDFNREFGFASIQDLVRRIYDIVYEATDVGIAAAEPGRSMADIAKSIIDFMQMKAARLKVPFEPGDYGRMGHGLGLRMCEPPSLSVNDHTPAQIGNVLTIEPNMIYYIDVDGEKRRYVLVHEENIALTAGGPRLLTRRAPPAMPLIN